MTSVTPTSESTSPPVPNVTNPRPPVIPGGSNLSINEQETWSWSVQKSKSPVHSIPRKCITNFAKNLSDVHAPLGFEPEGRSCGDTSGFQEDDNSGATSLDCLKWAENLQSLLNDAEGLNLFQQFLEQEDPDRFHMLEFWLACKGLSKQPPAQAHQLVRVIYAQLFLKAQLGIGEELRRSITQQIKKETSEKKLLSPSIFNEACAVVERVMNEVMHPNFLSSDIYLSYVQKMQAEACNLDASCEAASSPREAPALPDEPDDDELPETLMSQALPVVDEDKELSCTASLRSIHPKPPPDSFPARFLRQFGSTSRPSPYRRLYNCSYNPVSRQDSELQSLSSDARTDSMSDLSYDEMSSSKETYAYKRQLQRQQRQERQSANMNQNSDLTFNLIPRTSNPHARESAKPLQPEVFAKNLIFKLEKLKKERDAEEEMAIKLSAMEDVTNEPLTGDLAHQNAAETFMQKNEDECQEILDNHVSRVWSDKTPRRSPSLGTPVRPKSPDGRKAWPSNAPLNKATTSRVAHSFVVGSSAKRKDKDVCSLFSSDSGNGTDPTEGVEHRCRSLPKSKTMPESSEQIYGVDRFPGHCQRGASKAWSSSRRTLTDSGVSMVSGGHVENLVPQSPQHKDKFVSSWLLDSNRVCGAVSGRGATCSVISEEKDSIISSSSKHKARTNVAAGYPHGPSRSKAGMPDRGVGASSGAKNILPGQPFVADPSMPPFPFHSVDTDTQLEETRRRLNEMGPKLNKFSAAMAGSSKTCENAYSGMYPQISPKTEIPPQRPTTLTRTSHKSYSEEPSYTSVVYNFSDEQMPYLLRVPHSPVTLKQFKEYMPKKGRYRYFFVTPCEDLEMQPIQEEITDDSEYLPLWKGKVIAQIKAVD